ncbi:glycosyltransferase [Citricoccus zhacaiensis]|nr:glycosyltransferase [Citricoccus zhacaiensis]
MENFYDLTEEYDASHQLILSDSVPHSEIPAIMDTCQVGMIGYGRELGRASLPNRLFEYMSRGLAIMAPTYSPLIREIIEKYDIGICCDFEDPQSIANGIEWFQDNPDLVSAMGKRSREAFLRDFSWDAEFSKLLDQMGQGIRNRD